MAKVVVAARSMQGTWTPGRRWGPEPVIVDADDKLMADLKAADPRLLVVCQLPETPAPAPAKGK